MHIYGYGKIIDQQYNLNKDLHVFYGENEAGKSTLLSFIHSILFGFPTKVQTENRYEPKNGVKYGGKITIQSEHDGVITVERTAGKATGDVMVYFEDGRVGKETELNELLHGMDKRVFTSIFSFGMKGLQDIHVLKADDLNDYLFSSSVLGNEQVSDLEKRLNKELDQLFKPSGKKPEINQELESLSAFSKQVMEAKQQIDEYEHLIEEEKGIESELFSIQEEAAKLRENFRKLELFEQYYPFSAQYKMLTDQQESLREYTTFPNEGIKRLDMISASLLPIEARKKGLDSQLKEISSKIDQLYINECLLQLEKEIKEITFKLKSYEEDKSALDRIEANIDYLQAEIDSSKTSLGIFARNEQLLSVDFTLAKKEDLRKSLKIYENALQKKEMLVSRQDQTNQKLERAIESIKQYEQQRLPLKDREQLSDILEKAKTPTVDRGSATTKLHNVTNQLKNYERKLEMGKKLGYLLFLPLFLVTTVAGGLNFSSNLSMALTFLVLSVLFLSAVIFVPKLNQNHSLFTMLQNEKHELESKLFNIEGSEKELVSNIGIVKAQQLLARDEQLVQFISHDKILQEQLEKEAETYIDELEAWEGEWFEVSRVLEKIKEELYIPKQYSYDSLLGVYEHLEKLVAKLVEYKNREIEKEKLKKRITSFEENVQLVLDRIGFTLLPPMQLLEEVEKEKEKARQLESLKEKEYDIQQSIEKLEEEIHFHHKERQKLFEAAGTDEEEAFREKATLHSQWLSLQKRKEDVKEKMLLIVKNDDNVEQELIQKSPQFLQQLKEKEFMNNQRRLIEEQEEELRKSLAKVVIQKSQLEQNGTYSTLVHQLELKKAALSQLAKKWAKLSIAKDVLARTKNYYQHVRLPSVIKKAEQYFVLLTSNEYRTLFAPQDQGSFIVERNDGTRFTPQELSQGTTEQLYLSLRLALAESYQTPITFPLSIDDSFVNFDKQRTNTTLQLVKKLANERQIIFFTCHKDMVEGLQVEMYTNLSSNMVTTI